MNGEAGYQGVVKKEPEGIGERRFLYGKMLRVLDHVGEDVVSDGEVIGKHYDGKGFKIESTYIDGLHVDRRLTIEHEGEPMLDGSWHGGISIYGDINMKSGPWEKLCSLAKETLK